MWTVCFTKKDPVGSTVDVWDRLKKKDIPEFLEKNDLIKDGEIDLDVLLFPPGAEVSPQDVLDGLAEPEPKKVSLLIIKDCFYCDHKWDCYDRRVAGRSKACETPQEILQNIKKYHEWNLNNQI